MLLSLLRGWGEGVGSVFLLFASTLSVSPFSPRLLSLRMADADDATGVFVNEDDQVLADLDGGDGEEERGAAGHVGAVGEGRAASLPPSLTHSLSLSSPQLPPSTRTTTTTPPPPPATAPPPPPSRPATATATAPSTTRCTHLTGTEVGRRERERERRRTGQQN